MMGVFCKNDFNTIIVNVFLSNKLNDNYQVDMVDMFQSKHFKRDLCLPCALALCRGTDTVLGVMWLHPPPSLCCVKRAREKKRDTYLETGM